ncbi:hypothetical protein Tco_0127608 [Tanacetum coccineum]
MTNGREITPPLGFLNPQKIPSNTTSERLPINTTVFAATTPENTLFAYHASTSTNPNPTISPGFIEANYEIIESPLRERRRQICNEDLQTKLEYFSEDYDEEREMEPRLEPCRKATLTLRRRSPRVRRQRERVVGFEDAPNREGNRRGRNAEGHQPSTNMGGNLPPNGTLLSQHAQPFIPSSLHIPTGLVPTPVNTYFQPPVNLVHGQSPNFLFQTQMGNPPVGGASTYQGGYPFYAQPMYAPPNMPAYPNPAGPFVDSAGSVTPFVRWIEDYPLPDGLKMPSHIGSYDGKWDPDNFLHLFEGAIHMHKWLMPVPCHMFTYTLKDSARICQQKKFTKTHLAVHNIKRREGKSTRAFITRYTDDTLQILGLHKEQRISGFVHGLRTRSLVEHLSTDLPSTYKGLMEKTYTWVKPVEESEGNSSHREGCEKLRATSKDVLKTVFLTNEADEGAKRARKIHATSEERIISCVNTEEQIIVNDKYPDQTVTIEKQLPNHFKKEMQSLLKSNADIFAWTHTDITRILRTIMVEGKPFNTEHKLNKYNHIKPIKQNKRGLGPDRNMAACKEIEELMKAEILRKVKHQTWVANPVIVKKSDGGWRMCVDFTNINKAGPKDCYPLPEIDWKIESLSGFRLKCFLDAYKGYHQIQMAEEDEDKTAFYAGEGVFCYKKMPFGLKNAGATYQRLVDKLNPKKCSFGVEEVPFLGHLVTKHGIKSNLSNVKAVTDLEQPITLKDIQSLNGKLAALSRFLSKGVKRSLAFFKVLKECKDKKSIQWTMEAEKALEKMKKLVQSLPTLTALRVGETLTMHLAASKESISVVLAAKNNETKEKPKEVPNSSSKWRLYTDRASNSDGSGAGLMLIDPEGLRIAQEMETAKVAIFLDSQLLNKKADALFKLASMTFEHLTKEVLVEVLTKGSIEEKEVSKVDTQERKSWMDPIHEYLLSGLLP